MSEDNRRYLRALIGWLLLLALGFAFWRWLAGYLIPFVMAAVLGAFLDPLVSWGERCRLPRAAASLAGLTALLVATAGAAGLFVSILMVEMSHLAARLPRLYHLGQRMLDGALTWAMAAMDWRVPDATRLLNAHLGTAYQLAAAVIRAVGLTLLALPNALLVAALTLIATFFLLRDKGVWVHAADWLVPPAYRRRLPDLQGEVVRGTLGFVRAQLLVVGSTTLATTLGLWVYGSRYALLLGLAAGLLDLVPFLGPSALLGPWAVVMAVSGHPWAALELAAVLTGVMLVRQLAEPRLVAQGTGLHPLTALVALYVGIRLFGPWGFVVGPVTALILKAAARAAELPPYQAAPGP